MFRVAFLTVAILVFCLTSAGGQETAATCSTSSLYGRVLSSDSRTPVPQSWIVQVTARSIDTKIFDTEESQGEMYCVKVPLFAKAFLFFESGGYDPQRTEQINTSIARKKHSFALPLVKLDPIAATQGATRDWDPQQAQPDIHAKLNKHKDALRATNSNDIFTWNVERYRNLYRNAPEILRQIDQFVTELKDQPQFLFVSTSEYDQKSKLFSFIIARNQGQPVEVNIKPADLAALVNDLRVFSGIRLEAISALTSLDSLRPNETAQAAVALTKALEQDNSASIRTNAARALAKFGNPEALDVLQRVSKEDESPEVRVAADAATIALLNNFARNEQLQAVAAYAPTSEWAYTVVEYPLRKEITVPLNPVTIAKGKGVATILRDDNGTRIVLTLRDVPADVNSINLYAIDETGAVTSLGPLAVSDGAGRFNGSTPLTKFMLIASSETTLTAYDPNTKILFRSAVPEGFAVIPHTRAGVGETVAASPGWEITPKTYTAPMLNIPAHGQASDGNLRVNFSGDLSRAHATVFLRRHKDGRTEIRMQFNKLKEAPAGQVYVVWAVSRDNRFVKIGQLVNAPSHKEMEIKAETTLEDFGLFITMEDSTAVEQEVPQGPRLAVVETIVTKTVIRP